MNGLLRTEAPAIEPLTIAEVVKHLRLDATTFEPVPAKPTVARVNPAQAGALTAGSYRYRVTFVTDDGETDGGDVSEAVAIADASVNGRIAVTAIPVGGAAVTARRLYRTVADGSVYLLLATIADNTTTSYTDNIADASLGAAAPTANTTGDPELRAMIETAREYVEDRTRRSLIRQTWELTLDAFPRGDTIALPRAPLLAVNEVRYIDANGDGQVLAADTYSVDARVLPPRIVLRYQQTWPTTRCQRGAVTIEYDAGYGDAAANVPSSIRSAMKLLIGHWYANREGVVIGTITANVPMAVESLLAAYCVPEAA